ncbi:MAG TPA: hypothetical protein DCW68_00665 [Rhodospirillaceae bacterium]|nr:MAG: hypothetical protein A2018_00940 [Alphaproteobacteria bacterium GWF2_58_20]HAU28613.1 hypothetical protein [Rhodospirillaceae bacterium]
MDYLYFLHGLFLILLACAAIGLRRDVAFPIGFIAVFAIFQGLDVLLRIPLLCCISMTQSVLFFHILFQLLAGLALVVLVYRETPRPWHRVVIPVFLALVGLELFSGWVHFEEVLEISSIHMTVVFGMGVAFLMWWRARRISRPWALRASALAFAGYICLTGSRYGAGMLPGSLIEEIALGDHLVQIGFSGVLAFLIFSILAMGIPGDEISRTSLWRLLWKRIGLSACVIFIVLAGGVWAASFAGNLSGQHFKNQLIDRVRILQSMLDPDDMEALLQGASHPHYREVYEAVTRAISSQNDIIYGYVVALRDDQIVFLLDAEATIFSDHEDIVISDPGAIYEDESPAFKAILRDHQEMPIAEGPLSDAWGTWISAVVPLKGSNGQVVAALGMDVDTQNYNRLMDQTRLPVIGIVGAICLAIAIWHIQRNKEMRTAARLALSEKHYHDIFSGAPVGIFETSLDGAVVDNNQACLDILGYSDDLEAKVISRKVGVAEAVYADPSVREQILKLVMQDDIWHKERLRMRRKDGRHITVSMTIRGVHDTHGRLLRLQGFIEDITARVMAEQGLEEQTLFLQQLINAIPTPVYFKSLDGKYQNGNKAFADLISRTPEEYRGREVFEVCKLEEAEIFHAKDMELLEKGGMQTYEATITCDKGVRNLMFHKALTLHTDGNRAGIVGVVFDITDIKQTEERLRQSEAKIRSILDALPDLLFVSDISGIIHEVRAPAPGMLLKPVDQLLGKDLREILPEMLVQEFLGLAQGAVSGKKTIIWEYAIDIHGEKRFFEGRIAPMDARRVVLVSRDVTDRCNTEEKLLQTKLELEAANAQLSTLVKQAQAAAAEAERASRAKSEFLANMSHELRTPLNAIMGFSEMISSEMLGAIENQNYKEYIGYIHASGAHLLDIINDVLDLSRIEAGKMQIYHTPVEVAGIFRMAGNLILPRLAETEQGLKVSVADNVPAILGDERLIKQIILNLLSNAHKFSPKKAQITLSARRLGETEVELVVSDTGIGMQREEIALALQPFVQLENYISKTQQGTGLGLPLVKAFTELQGGRLVIESKPGKGTTVRVILRVFEPGMPVSTFQIPPSA